MLSCSYYIIAIIIIYVKLQIHDRYIFFLKI